MTDWFGGRGQGKWLTNTVMQWCSDAVVEGKSNDWLVWWQGARQMTDWFGGRGQGKWLTGLVAGGKANDWLTQWCGDAVMQWCGDVVMRWYRASQMTDWFGSRGQGKWLTGLFAGGKANDWLVWWHGDVVAWDFPVKPIINHWWS